MKTILVCFIAILPMIAAAQNSVDDPGLRESPWLLTDEERIAERFRAVPMAQAGQANRSYEIDGKRDPHLFMPHELFDMLLKGVGDDAEMRDRGRKARASGLKFIGFADPDVFWSDLEKVARPYL